MRTSFSCNRTALALLGCLTAWPVFGATRSFPGATPCNGTLQACIDAADSGDVLELDFDGTNGESLDIRKSITLRPAAGRTPTVTGVMAYATTETIDVTLQSLHFNGALLGLLGPGGGNLRLQAIGNIFPSAGGTSIELRTTTTAGAYGSFLATIEGNRLGVTGGDFCSDGLSVQLYQPGEGSSEVVLRGNEVTANNLSQCAGISVYQSDGQLDLTIDRNQVHGSLFNGGIGVRARGGQMQAGIYNNLVYGQSGHTGAPGAIVVNADGTSDVTAHLVNNTVAHNGTGMWVAARTDEGARLRGTMRNNIAAFNTRYGLDYQRDLAPGFVESHNLIHGNEESEEPLPADPHRRTGNPAFADAASGNYRLTASSDAINRGMSSALPGAFDLDLAGAARIIGGVIDMGAYEYPQVIVTPPTPTAVTAVPTVSQWALLALGSLLGLAGIRRLPRQT